MTGHELKPWTHPDKAELCHTKTHTAKQDTGKKQEKLKNYKTNFTLWYHRFQWCNPQWNFLCSVYIFAVSLLILLHPAINSGSPQHLIELLTQFYSCISDEILPNLNPVWHGTLMAIGEGERMRHQVGRQWPERHLQSRLCRPRPAGGSIAALVLFTICFDSTRKRTRRRASSITMAAADSGAKPIQNAMKMAKVAIQLDGGNKHKVGSVAVRPQSQHGGFIAE